MPGKNVRGSFSTRKFGLPQPSLRPDRKRVADDQHPDHQHTANRGPSRMRITRRQFLVHPTQVKHRVDLAAPLVNSETGAQPQPKTGVDAVKLVLPVSVTTMSSSSASAAELLPIHRTNLRPQSLRLRGEYE
jgi:hypothetical protein